ncbi:MAG TPA: isoprenylcysteine carboxylmethyltransferase family protein [Blastocatellia bacterium]|nr:isoprenylcysteine carboxylmethyltransferase family protein [Blastocatellia bacterium]
MIKRVIGFGYGVVCYLIFFGTFLYAIGFVGGGNLYGAGKPLIVPRSIDLSVAGEGEGLIQRLIINALLLSLFAVQHSVMARQWFKRRWTKMVAPLLERSTFVLVASLLLLLLFWEWRPIGTDRVAWNVENSTARLVLQALFWAGWLIVLISTFLVDHFDLFGLKQVYCYLRGVECPPLAFKTPAFYKGVRHPIYLGFIIAFWATPRMSMGHLFFAIMTTAYILVAIQFEERDLIRHYGDAYKKYREHVSMLTPISWRREQPEAGEDKPKAAGAGGAQ